MAETATCFFVYLRKTAKILLFAESGTENLFEFYLGIYVIIEIKFKQILKFVTVFYCSDNSMGLMRRYSLNVKGRILLLDNPLVMGILNVTPDSFYEASRIATSDDLVVRAKAMIDEGADILDIGACSTRPSGCPVTESEELRRLHAVLDVVDSELPDAVVSVDTFRASVARECVERHNVSIVNDVSGFSWDEAMLDTVAGLNVPYVLTHSQGWAGESAVYKDFLPEVLQVLSQKMWQLRQLGVNDVIIDPGFGFGKSLHQNYCMMAHLKEFAMLEAPVLVGISRKSMISKVLGTTSDEALNGTTVLNTHAIMSGADILRVHDVKQAKEAVKICSAIKAANMAG